MGYQSTWAGLHHGELSKDAVLLFRQSAEREVCQAESNLLHVVINSYWRGIVFNRLFGNRVSVVWIKFEELVIDGGI